VAQAYSSLLYDGPTIHSVFNGVYKVAFDYNENEETKTWVDTFVESEQANGPNTHLLPTKVTDPTRRLRFVRAFLRAHPLGALTDCRQVGRPARGIRCKATEGGH
jgi:hypothetical protein